MPNDEPWAIICQMGTRACLGGRGIHYAAGLEGDASEEITQNWQRVKVKAQPPEMSDPSRWGLLTRVGEGLVKARQSVTELAECLLQRC